MQKLASLLRSPAFTGALSFFILSLGCGRILSLVLHDPMLAYANNYEMIPLQACQQIWPADNGIDITRGTVAAPLRHYTLDKHVDTPCIDSSELFFTRIGIALAKTLPSSQKGILSLQTIGLVKALFLVLTAFIAQVIFFRHKQTTALFAHALVVLCVLSDPGITLYLSTFYTEFSAVYFLYLAMLAASFIFLQQDSHTTRWLWLGSSPLLACGIIGFGLSKAFHAPVLVCMGLLLALYFLVNKPKLACIPVILATVTPLVLENTGTLTLANDNMILANKINTVATIIDTTPTSRLVLGELGLPDSCLGLAGKNWYMPVVQKNRICFELDKTSQTQIAFFLLKHPSIFSSMAWAGLPRAKEWILSRYGQVESEKQGDIAAYYWTLGDMARPASEMTLLILLSFPAVLATTILLANLLMKKSPVASLTGFWLLSLLPPGIYMESLLEGGLVDLPKHIHLVTPLVLSVYLVMLTGLVARLSGKLFSPRTTPPRRP